MTDIVDTFYVLDLDRCLLDTDKLHAILEQVIARRDPTDGLQLAQAKRDAEAGGRTFDTYKYVHALVADRPAHEGWLAIERQFLKEAKKQNVLMDHARELLDILESKHTRYGILTYGIEAWQLVKLEASGLMAIPHEITHIKEKGMVMRGWVRPDGTFAIPPGMGGLVAQSITFLDDKAVSFTNLPRGIKGIRIQPVDQPLLPAQVGALPASVTEVKGLAGAIELIFGE